MRSLRNILGLYSVPLMSQLIKSKPEKAAQLYVPKSKSSELPPKEKERRKKRKKMAQQSKRRNRK
ncbi:hypothetical protein [Fictibacillus fluitans]|uniref:Uncharacterized protein n=1 Tax=Fictibacillus fluitans TaxID=3058422 RepID=A0ABT8HX42_9BACL|nr:hypothetical protein [Fictibacillus sp. NE201]MDN4525357.1 hypothetical protein [Fictibacillus sp. NE201]